MGVYWEAVNVDHQERLGVSGQPFAAKDGEWIMSLASKVLTHLMLTRWNGCRISFVSDAAWEPDSNGASYGDGRDIWREVMPEFRRLYGARLSDRERDLIAQFFRD